MKQEKANPIIGFLIIALAIVAIAFIGSAVINPANASNKDKVYNVTCSDNVNRVTDDIRFVANHVVFYSDNKEYRCSQFVIEEK